MATLMITIGVFTLCFVAMAAGVLIRGNSLKGSCGGAAEVLGEESCGACAKKENEICPTDDETGLVAIAEIGNPARTIKDDGTYPV